MDSNIADDFIQKKRIYRHEAMLDRVEIEYYNHMFPSIDYPTNLSQEEMIKEIEALELLNFKNRALLLSNHQDICQNEQQILLLGIRLVIQTSE